MKDVGPTALTNAPVTTNANIGSDPTGSAFLFNGLLDDVRIYNRALSKDEIKRLYNLGGTVKLNTSTVSNNSLAKGLVGWWTFDGKDISGVQAYDRSGNGSRGILTNGPVRGIGKLGQALLFDGANDYINFGDPVPLRINGDLTIAAWVKTRNTTKGEMMIITQVSGGDNRNYQLYLTTNADLDFTHGSGAAQASYAAAGTSLADGNWHHVAFTADYPTGTYYIDGRNVKTITMSFDIIDTDTNNYETGGTEGGSADTIFDGLLDDVRVYSRALSADEIKRLYNLRGTVKLNSSQNLNNNNSLQNGLVGWRTFDGKDMSGVQAYDRSGNGNRGILTSGPVRTLGKIGQALDFDGVDDYVEVLDSNSLDVTTAFSFSVWAKVSANGADEVLISKDGVGADTEGAYNFAIAYDGALAYETNNVASVASASNVVPRNVWNHLAVTRDANTSMVKLYVNGQLLADGTPTAPSVLGTNLLIGRRGLTTDSFVKGLLDDVRIYNRTLSGDEIKRLYNMGR